MRKYSRNIIFTKTPLKGIFRFDDIFQIYPLNLANGINSEKAKLFPCLIEFWIDSEDIQQKKIFDSKEIDATFSEGTTFTNKIIEITDLLSTISNFRFIYNRSPDVFWSLQIPEDNAVDVNSLSSHLSIDLYYYPTMAKELAIEEFSNPDFKDIELIPKNEYYSNDPIESKNKVINFPDNIYDVLRNYFNLPKEKKIIINATVYQLTNAIDLQVKMKSLSFLSAVSSIETLVTYENKNIKVEYECNDCKTLKTSSRACKKCNRPIWGMAANFREFLFKYVSSKEGAHKFYNEIYNIRSKIAHTEYLINSEQFLNWDFSDKTGKVNLQLVAAIQLGRRSVNSWILFSE